MMVTIIATSDSDGDGDNNGNYIIAIISIIMNTID